MKRGWAGCAECKDPIRKSKAVGFNGKWYHPISCFAKALKRATRAIDAFLRRGGE